MQFTRKKKKIFKYFIDWANGEMYGQNILSIPQTQEVVVWEGGESNSSFNIIDTRIKPWSLHSQKNPLSYKSRE